jgi:hypothetical protein
MSETQYLVQGRNVFVKNTRDNPPTEKNLPVGIYDVQFNPDIGFYLQVRDEFELPKKLYGKTQFRTHRILDTFESRPYVTGVLLHGVKGSGKSMEAKNIAIEGVQRGLSTLVVSSAWAGPSFNKFLASIHDNIIVLFDEFEKVYDKEQQPALLTLLDGMIQTKMLCVFTANDTSKIDSHMINRPGRIFYSIKYEGLDLEFVKEYCEDNLKDKDKTDVVMQVAEFVDNFNFDMLQAVIEEHNRYGGKIKEILPLLNIKMDNIYGSNYLARLFINGKIMNGKDYFYPHAVSNPFSKTDLTFSYEEKLSRAKLKEQKEQGIDDSEDRCVHLEFDMADAIVSRGKKFIEFNYQYSDEKTFKLILEKQEYKPLNVLDQLNE